MQRLKRKWAVGAVLTAVALSALGSTSAASAHTGEFAKFNNCPSTNPAVFACLYSVTTGGKVVLGKKTVPIVNPVVLQGGTGYANAELFQQFFPATNGVTLSKTPQPVPGGLAGLVNCKEITNFFERVACEAAFENGLTGVNATLELAKPASEIKISEAHLLFEEGIALKLPVKVHLENPFLGSECYVGSSSSPINWNLTTAATSPPPPNKPIHGKAGEFGFQFEGEIIEFKNNELVDNAWSAPAASGCGGAFSLLIDPLIDLTVGVPSAAGKNTAIEINHIYQSEAEVVNKH